MHRLTRAALSSQPQHEYDVSDERRFAGDQARAVSILKSDWAVFSSTWRSTPLRRSAHSQATHAGRPMERRRIQAVAELPVRSRLAEGLFWALKGT